MPLPTPHPLSYEDNIEYKRLCHEAQRMLGGWDELAGILRMKPKALQARMQDNYTITYESLYAIKWIHHLAMIKHAQENRGDRK